LGACDVIGGDNTKDNRMDEESSMNFKHSQQWLERGKEVIPYPYNQTFSKSIDMYVQGVSPIFAKWGKGPYLYDVDDNRFLDLVMGLGPLILGYKHVLTEGMREALPIYSLPHQVEVELSELLCEIIPCAEMVRFGKNGSDVTTAAVRLARAVTGRDVVLQCGYHGWHDWCMAHKWRNKGIPEDVKNLTIPFEYNDLHQLLKEITRYSGSVACLIMEPVTFEPPGTGYTEQEVFGYFNFLEVVRKECDKEGILLIFDEMITGFRWSLGGAQEYFGVTPDLACFGKGMANGWPVSALVGKKEYMEHFKDVHFSFTFGGEVLSLQAAYATIRFLQQNPVIEHLWTEGAFLLDRLEELAYNHAVDDVVQVDGWAVWPRLLIENNLVKSFISQELIKRGILWMETFNLSYSHKRRHIEDVLTAFDEIFDELALVLADHREDLLESRIEGEPIKARQVRSWQDQ